MKAARSIIVGLAFLVCFLAVWGCGSRKAAQLPSLPPTLIVPDKPPGPQAAPSARPALPASAPIVTAAVDCKLLLGQGETFEAVATVGLSERVDSSHAPHPTNESERLLFRQLYETLVHADCNGRPMPGLAASWRLDAVRNIWIVALRPNAWFSNNKPVTAMDVVSSWTRTGGDNGRELRPEVRHLVRSVVAVDDRTLEFELQSRRADAVIVLAHTDLAVAAPAAGSPWPMGTRPVRMDSTASSAITLSTLFGNSSIRFLIAPGRDSRDLLDQGSDLVLTRDPRTVDYAVTLPQFQISPLPWQRTYVLLTPNRAGAMPSFSADERRAIAQDAVRGPARGAEGPFWWESLPDCDIGSPQPPPVPASGSPRIVYDVDDSAARELAERFVGIGKYPRASGLTGDALAQALRRGNESAYILSVDRRPLDACREMQVLMEKAGWIDPQSIVPLVDTRLQAIVRRGRSGLITEWDGTLLLELRN